MRGKPVGEHEGLGRGGRSLYKVVIIKLRLIRIVFEFVDQLLVVMITSPQNVLENRFVRTESKFEVLLQACVERASILKDSAFTHRMYGVAYHSQNNLITSRCSFNPLVFVMEEQ
jgi:hypothetical protein